MTFYVFLPFPRRVITLPLFSPTLPLFADGESSVVSIRSLRVNYVQVQYLNLAQFLPSNSPDP